jgi:hypothetical protein
VRLYGHSDICAPGKHGVRVAVRLYGHKRTVTLILSSNADQESLLLRPLASATDNQYANRLIDETAGQEIMDDDTIEIT